MRVLAPIISALAIPLYLAAAFLPCEPTDAFVPPRPAVHAETARTATAAPVGMHADGANHGSHSSRSAHTSSHPPSQSASARGAEHAAAGSHAAPDVRHDHEHDHDLAKAQPAPGRAAARADRTDPQLAELVRKCVCGCSETRSTVGGGAARLGSVVPGSVLARLAAAPDVLAEDRLSPRAYEVLSELDPIPI